LLGSATSATRTPEQTDIARFWADGAGSATPPGHWNLIAQDVAEMQGNTVSENARLFALLNIATADAAIACWDNKYAYNFWRPITAIHEADSDGNPDTTQDLTWAPLLPTPPFPSYTSGHSTFSSAAATILAAFFGTDDIAFTASSEAPGVADRSFLSFSEAAEEAGRSRIYGGIHFQFDNQDALAIGNALGHFVYRTQLTAVPEPPGSLLVLIGMLGLAAARSRRLSSESASPDRTASMRPRVAMTRCCCTPEVSRQDSTSLTYWLGPDVVMFTNRSLRYPHTAMLAIGFETNSVTTQVFRRRANSLVLLRPKPRLCV